MQGFFWGLWWGRSETSLDRRVSYGCLKQEAKAFFFHFYLKIKKSVAPSVVGWPGLKHLPVFPARKAIRDFVRAARGSGVSWAPVPSVCPSLSPLPGLGFFPAQGSEALNCWDGFSCQKLFAYCSEVLARTFMSSLRICEEKKNQNNKPPVENGCYFRREPSFNILTVSLRTGRAVI